MATASQKKDPFVLSASDKCVQEPNWPRRKKERGERRREKEREGLDSIVVQLPFVNGEEGEEGKRQKQCGIEKIGRKSLSLCVSMPWMG